MDSGPVLWTAAYLGQLHLKCQALLIRHTHWCPSAATPICDVCKCMCGWVHAVGCLALLECIEPAALPVFLVF